MKYNIKHLNPGLVFFSLFPYFSTSNTFIRRLSFLYPLGENDDRSFLHECLLAPPTTGHHLIVYTWK